MNKINKWFNKIQEMPKNQKTIYYGIATVIVLFCYLALTFFTGSVVKSLKALTSEPLKSSLYYGFVDKDGRTISLIVCVIFTIIVLVIYFRINHRNSVESTDERGIDYMEKGVHGTSTFMDEDEASMTYEVANINDTATTIYGQLTDNGEKVVGYKPNAQGGSGDQNYAIIGSPGTGKSYVYVRTELLQTIKRNESFIVTDPSTEIYTSLGEYGRNKGYDIKVLNLAEPSHSDCWDMLEETINPETERLDGTRLNDFVNIYMKNSSDEEGKSEEKFWYDCAKNLLTAVIGGCAYEREFEIVSGYKSLYKQILNYPSDNEAMQDEVFKKMDKASFKWSRYMILKAAKQFGYKRKEIDTMLNRIHEYAPRYSISEVYDAIMNFGATEEKLNWIPSWHPARIAYKIFQTNSTSETVRSSALQGAQMRMQLFGDEKIKYILSNKGIHLSDCNKNKTGIFVITSDKTTSTKPIASLVFSFLFKDAQDEYDKAEQLAKEKNIPNERLPITVMLDEFFSVGVIGGNPKSFATTMANSRKRQLHISIIIQAYPQVRALYGIDNAMTILNCCGTIIFLGCNDPETAKFISDFIAGDATVLSESHHELNTALARADNGINVSSTARKLMTVDEVRRFKNAVLIAKRGEHPLKLRPFPWTSHPAYINGEIVSKSVYSTIKNLDKAIEDEFYRIDNKNEEREKTDKMIKELNGTVVVNQETGELVEKQQEVKAENLENIEKKKQNKTPKQGESELNV